MYASRGTEDSALPRIPCSSEDDHASRRRERAERRLRKEKDLMIT